MTGRRSVLKGMAGAVPTSLIGASTQFVNAAIPEAVGRDYFAELGLKPFINAAGAYSTYGGARMRPEVVQTMRFAATQKVRVRELHDAVGVRIAELVGSEAAMVTSGATASIVLGTAACMTRGDEARMRQLPDTTGIRNEVIIQKKHRNTYDRALIVPGAKLVEVQTEEDVHRAAGDRTAMMFFLLPTQRGDDIPAARYREIAAELGIPTFCDAATTTPPGTNVVEGAQAGFDLICYSGGKGLRGPYSAGLLIGRRDLVSFARRHGAPNDLSIGRGMKVSIEEYIGMLVALQTSLGISEVDDLAFKQGRFDRIIEAIHDLPGVEASTFVSGSHAREMYLDINWDTNEIDLTREDFVQALRDNDPSIEIRLFAFSGGRIHLSATVMADGEDVIVGEAIRRILHAHS